MADPTPAPRAGRPADGVLIARCELTGTPHAPGEARQFIRKHLDGQAHLEDTVLNWSPTPYDIRPPARAEPSP